MGTEIERKFLVKGDGWRRAARGMPVRQGYLCADEAVSVRVRVAGARATLTIKGAQHGLSRAEYEYPLPLADAEALLDTLCRRPLIEKTRYQLEVGGKTWVVDEFAGDNAGLIVAEVELEGEEEPVVLPEWAGQEVSDDPRYLNVNLARHPFRRW